jgi:hypothetical protein
LAIPTGSVFRSVFVFVGIPTVRFRNLACLILQQRAIATKPGRRARGIGRLELAAWTVCAMLGSAALTVGAVAMLRLLAI